MCPTAYKVHTLIPRIYLLMILRFTLRIAPNEGSFTPPDQSFEEATRRNIGNRIWAQTGQWNQIAPKVECHISYVSPDPDHLYTWRHTAYVAGPAWQVTPPPSSWPDSCFPEGVASRADFARTLVRSSSTAARPAMEVRSSNSLLRKFSSWHCESHLHIVWISGGEAHTESRGVWMSDRILFSAIVIMGTAAWVLIMFQEETS
jgi:hypothetical protein